MTTRHELDWIDHQFDALGCHLSAAMSDVRANFEHALRRQLTTFMFGLVAVVVIMAALTFALVCFA